MKGQWHIDGEIWKPIAGFDGFYEVSSLGRVRSCSRTTAVRSVHRRGGVVHDEMWHRPGMLLKPVKCDNGYYVRLYNANHERKSIAIKRLVAEAFIPSFNPENPTNSIRVSPKTAIPTVHNIQLR